MAAIDTAACDRLLDRLEDVVVGKRSVLELVLMCLLADGHILLEDLPGLGKTLIAQSVAQVLSLQFGRVQFTPDLMPSDISGVTIFDQASAAYVFRPGPVFTHLLLADEINRAPAKTQAALLEAMQERQVTVDGVTRPLERPFLVMATQNPIEFEGTYALPEAQLDRFMARIPVGYPRPQDEVEMLQRRMRRGSDGSVLEPVLDRAGLLSLQQQVEAVEVEESVAEYIVELVGATRVSPRLTVGASPRGSLALLKLARARAVLRGRDFVVPEDVKQVAVPALAHRLSLKPELWVQRFRAEDAVSELLATVPVPATLPRPA